MAGFYVQGGRRSAQLGNFLVYTAKDSLRALFEERPGDARLMHDTFMVDFNLQLIIVETGFKPLLKLIVKILLGLGIVVWIKAALADELVRDHAGPCIFQ